MLGESGISVFLNGGNKVPGDAESEGKCHKLGGHVETRGLGAQRTVLRGRQSPDLSPWAREEMAWAENKETS